MTSHEMIVMDQALGRIVMDARTLARSAWAFDESARRMIAAELREAARAYDPQPIKLGWLAPVGDFCGRKLYRTVRSVSGR